MTVFHALVLGIVQGLGEFLPISSSAHLILVPWLFNWPEHSLTFDVALHLGTLLAVIAYFWHDWLELVSHGLKGTKTPQGRLFWYIALASAPGALVGYKLEDYAETVFRTPLLNGVMLMAMGVILYLADRYGRKYRADVDLRESFLIGLSQALAIIPGVSRSGITMATGLVLGLSREAAARFSFLLSTPIIFGAGILKIPELGLADLTPAFFTGVISAAVIGFLSIKYLLRYLKHGGFALFVLYRLVLGTLVIFLALSGWR